MRRILFATGLILGSSLVWADATVGLSTDAPEVTVSPPAVNSPLKPSVTGAMEVTEDSGVRDEALHAAGRARDRLSRSQRSVRMVRGQSEVARAN